jgi:predicted  nucleic acid-binding Zn-ribbon protein
LKQEHAAELEKYSVEITLHRETVEKLNGELNGLKEQLEDWRQKSEAFTNEKNELLQQVKTEQQKLKV